MEVPAWPGRFVARGRNVGDAARFVLRSRKYSRFGSLRQRTARSAPKGVGGRRHSAERVLVGLVPQCHSCQLFKPSLSGSV